ncbi:hypothetical protein Ahy_B02g061495 [Arachis hypogaea]|uniref:FAR1 domain-containing protein n=1 Tax=Arachis hypogaea TaxID=3818 RepID=A0A445AL44_ARAHY|nr:hypothetical protein Ahy_B02g061495 [Arachis hypogaea]
MLMSSYCSLMLMSSFYKDYAKVVGFATKIRNTNRKKNEIKLITCNREGKWKSNISPTEKTNPSAKLNCSARIYVHILKEIGVVLNHSHTCYLNQEEMLKQHRQLSMFDYRTIKNNDEAGIRPSKTYQFFVAVVGGHRELKFIEKDVRNYITRKVYNKRINFFYKLELEAGESIKMFFGLMHEASLLLSILEMFCLIPLIIQKGTLLKYIYDFCCYVVEFSFVAWEERLQKAFLSINVRQCKGLLRFACQL